MSKLKVYISSTFLDLQVPRKKIIDRIQQGLSPYFELTTIMEKMKGDPENRSNQEICLDEVRSADLYFILIGKRYGSSPLIIKEKPNDKNPLPNKLKKSFTELEYDAACETLEKKFYGIYKLELTDEFFTKENIVAESDLGDAEILSRYNRFYDKLNESVSPIKIKSLSDLNDEINDLSTEFYLRSLVKEELKLGDADYNSIDRRPQLATAKNEREKLGNNCGAIALLVGLQDKADCPHEFTLKLQFELTGANPLNTKMEYIDSNILGSYSSGNNSERSLQLLLANSYRFIRGEKANNATFSMLTKDLDTNKNIMNVFIGIEVTPKIDMINDQANFLDTIVLFVKKINEIIKSIEFGFDFYFVIYIYSDEYSIASNYIKLFEGISCIAVDRLPSVIVDDARLWLDEIKSKSESAKVKEQDTDSLFKLIFLDPKEFPAKYKRCIELVKNRTK